MKSKLPEIAKRTYQRKHIVTIAEENAGITIEAFPFRIWLEDNKIYIEKVRITKEKFFHNEQELLEEQYGSETDFEAGNV